MKKKVVLKTGEKLEVFEENSRYYICKDRCIKKSGSLFAKEIIVEEKKKKEDKEEKKEEE